MAKKSLANVKEEFKDYGFDPAVIEIAYANVDGNTDRIMDEIFRLQSESSAYPTVYIGSCRNQQPLWMKMHNSAKL